ncbi:recombinase RecA [bacterium]|nr:recombinase RecA [bacterium]
MEKVTSGIEGFDQVLFGGFPQGRSYLVSGEPGAGKTIFTLQFLLEGLRQGEKAIYISIDERPEHVILDAEALGWPLNDYLKSDMFRIIDVTSYFSTSQMGDDAGIDINSIITDVLGFVREFNATRLVIDPIAPLIFSERHIPEVAEYIRKLIFAIEDNVGCTTLLTSYAPVGTDKVSHHGIEEFAASGIIILKLDKLNNKFIRTVRVKKMRGTRVDLSEYSFEILPQRGIVLRQPV